MADGIKLSFSHLEDPVSIELCVGYISKLTGLSSSNSTFPYLRHSTEVFISTLLLSEWQRIGENGQDFDVLRHIVLTAVCSAVIVPLLTSCPSYSYSSYLSLCYSTIYVSYVLHSHASECCTCSSWWFTKLQIPVGLSMLCILNILKYFAFVYFNVMQWLYNDIGA